MNPGTKMSAMNPANPVAAQQHQKNRFCTRVGFVFRVFAEHP